jgi:hypothetical protein
LEAEEHLAPNLQPGLDGAYLEFRCPPDVLAYYARLFAGWARRAQVQGPPELIRRLADLGAQLNEHIRPLRRTGLRRADTGAAMVTICCHY